MRLRMKISVSGTFWNDPEGVRVGDIVDIPNDVEAELMIKNGYAELANQGRRTEEHAVEQFSNEERAVLDTEIIGANDGSVPQPKTPRPPKVEDEAEKPKPAPKPAEPKRGPGRPSHK